MKLFYRGSAYEFNSESIEMIESEICARYRGLSYQIRRPVSLFTSELTPQLRFRGISYSKA